MTPIETASLVTSAIVLAIGTPIAFFHHRIAKELRHLRAHFIAHHKAKHRADCDSAPKHRAPRRKA